MKYSHKTWLGAVEATAVSLAVLLIFLFFNYPAASAVQKIRVTDTLNRTVELKHPAVRIICLSKAHAENITAIRGSRQIIGVIYSTDPRWVDKRVKRLSANPTAAQMAELRPDLVVADIEWARGNMRILKELDKKGIPCAVLEVPKLIAFADYIEKLGTLTGRTREAELALAQQENELYKAKLRSDGKKHPGVFVLGGADFSTCEPFSWGARIITSCGARLVTGKELPTIDAAPWMVQFGPEKLAEAGKNVDVIITLTGGERGLPALHASDLTRDPRFKSLPAVRNGRIYEMSDTDLNLPSLVRLESTLRECEKILYDRKK